MCQLLFLKNTSRKEKSNRVLVAHTYNASNSGGRDLENSSLKPAWVNSSRDPISKTLSQTIGLVEWLKV
jgi:hypothetical protein